MGYKTPHKLVINVGSASGSPADSTTYYMAIGTSSMDTTIDLFSQYFPCNGRVIGVDLEWTNSNAPTSENVSIYIRVNAVDTLIETAGLSGTKTRFSNLTLNIPVTTSDLWQLKIVTPAWVTNPTTVRLQGSIIMDFD